MIRKNIVYYETETGKTPVKDWLHAQDKSIRNRIDVRLTRVAFGHYGDCKEIKGVSLKELRFPFGKGYRVYFNEDGKNLIILLTAGDKSTQDKDIKKASEYWQDYLKRKGNTK